MGYSYTKNITYVYLKFKFNWESCTLSGNTHLDGNGCEVEEKLSQESNCFDDGENI